MSNSARVNAQGPWRPFQCFCRGKRRENFFLAKDPRNPLISLDLDERIQGNPRKSNTKKPRFRSGKAIRQENPNGPTGAAARLRCRGRFSLAEDARPAGLGVPSRFGSYLDADAVLAFVSVRWRLKSLMEAKWNVPSPVSASIEPSEKIL